MNSENSRKDREFIRFSLKHSERLTSWRLHCAYETEELRKGGPNGEGRSHYGQNAGSCLRQ